MTHEEAINRLKEEIDEYTPFADKWNEARLDIKALNMAIKALEYDDAKYHEEHGEVIVDKAVWEDAKKALEQKPCEDAISRQDAIKAIEEKAKRIKNEDTLNGLAGAVGILFDLPSVNPQEPKTGHWEKINESVGIYKYKCDRCGAYHRAMYDYCPSCGAKMVEPREVRNKE